ncbi:MAG: hypothetical protein IKY83_05800, partial [Proteobacteria bacterium]|nr:hypothetical protein [Pseudomonadota bacterium]
IPSYTLKTHHWSPIIHEVAYLETERDIRDAIYRIPKDMQIMPAIEALMLFDRIQYKPES